MVQWIRICLPLQGTQVPSLVREDSTRRGAAELQSLSPSPGACELQLLKPECPGACAPQQERPPQREAHTQLERSLHKATAQSEDPAQPKKEQVEHRTLLLTLHCYSICLRPPARLVFCFFFYYYYYFYSRFLMVIYFKYSSVYMPTPNYQSIP